MGTVCKPPIKQCWLTSLSLPRMKWAHLQNTHYFVFVHKCQLQYGVHLHKRSGWEAFIDSGLDNLFCLSVNCDVDSVFTVSAGFEGGLSRLLRKQMSTLQRLICLIRLAAPSIPAFIYLLTYLLIHLLTSVWIWFDPPSSPLRATPSSSPHFFFIVGPDRYDKPSEEGR